jgi:hypothetical protein
MKIGYFLSREEYTPAQLLVQAQAAEKAGFDGLWISDHFHPWNDEQGQSPAAHRLWADAGLPGELAQILPTPRHFEQASELVTRESTSQSVVAGPDVEEHLEQLRKYADAGYDEIHVANMGPNYLAMIEAYGFKLFPALTPSS